MRQHLGLTRYQPLTSNFGPLPNGALPALADTGQAWLTDPSPVVTAGVLVVNAGTGGAITADPVAITDGAYMVIGPPAAGDLMCLFCNYTDSQNETRLVIAAGGVWEILDTIAGVQTGIGGPIADPGSADGDLITLLYGPNNVVTAAKNGVVLMSGVSARPHVSRVGAFTGAVWGIRQLGSGRAPLYYP